MEEKPDEWHYTAGADQAGPVTFDELKALAASGALHPRQDLVWCQRMDEWKPAGEIDGLYERKEKKVEEREVVITDTGDKPVFTEVDLWSGATRRWYLLRLLVFPFIWIMIAALFAQFIGVRLSPGFQKLFLLIGIVVPVIVMIDVCFSRLTNLGMSKLWIIGYFIPLINLWVWYRSFACPAGYAKHKKMDGPGWLLAIVYWLAMVSLIGSSILIPATVSGLMQASGIHQQIESLRGQLEKVGKRPEEPKKKKKKKKLPDDPNRQAR